MLAESWCGSLAEWGDEGNSGRRPGAKHTSVGTAVGASVELEESEYSGDRRVDVVRSDFPVVRG